MNIVFVGGFGREFRGAHRLAMVDPRECLGVAYELAMASLRKCLAVPVGKPRGAYNLVTVGLRGYPVMPGDLAVGAWGAC